MFAPWLSQFCTQTRVSDYRQITHCLLHLKESVVYRERLKDIFHPPFSWTVKIQTNVPVLPRFIDAIKIGKRPSRRPNYFVCNHTRNQGSINSFSRLSRSNGVHICCRLKSEFSRSLTGFCVQQQWSNEPFLGIHPRHPLFKYWIQVIISCIDSHRKSCDTKMII